jgi:hypothetical protein
MHQFLKFTLAWNFTCFRQFHPGPARKLSTNLYDIPVPSVQWINSWWWAEELPEICRVSSRSTFGKLVYLVGFIIKKFVTVHGHMNVKNVIMLDRSSAADISWSVQFSRLLWSLKFQNRVHKSPPLDPDEPRSVTSLFHIYWSLH